MPDINQEVHHFLQNPIKRSFIKYKESKGKDEDEEQKEPYS